jgi:hypothetical protein
MDKNIQRPSRGGERYAVKDNTSVIAFRQPESIEAPLTEISVLIEPFAEERLPDGRQRVEPAGAQPTPSAKETSKI